MIRSLLKVALLSISASSNAVLTTPKGKYNTQNQPTIDTKVEIESTRFIKELSAEGNEDNTLTTMSQSIATTTLANVKFTNVVLTAYQWYTEEHDGHSVDWLITKNPNRQIFAMSLTKIEILNNTNIVVDINYLNQTTFINQDIDTYVNWKNELYITYNEQLDNYINTLWDYYNIRENEITAEMPFTYKNSLVNLASNNGTHEEYTSPNEEIYENYTMWNFWFEHSDPDDEDTPFDDAYTIYNTTPVYFIMIDTFTTPNENIYIDVADTQDPFLEFGNPDDPQENLKPISCEMKVYNVPITNYEVIDVPDLMFTIVGMPFTFISRAFNLTLFPNTPYAVNIGNIFLSLIGVLTFIFVLKVILKLKG